MAEEKSLKRPYHSSRREAQKRETRLQILGAARKLFSENGYTGATIEAIAQEAGVAPETVFAIFRNKRTILANLFDISVGGDDQPVALMNRPGPRSVLQEPEPALKIKRFAADIAGILERVAPLVEIARSAAKTEPEIAGLYQNILAARRHNLGILVSNLADARVLREGLSREQATDTVWAITSPEVYLLLTVTLGRAQEQYIAWLEDTLTRLLLP